MARLIEVADGPELEQYLSLGGHLLSAETIQRQSPDISLLLQGSDGTPVARCSLWWKTTPSVENHHPGYLGHYAAISQEAGSQLLSLACKRLTEERCSLAIGPIDGNTWQRYRLITERGTEPPFFLEPDNPDEWPDHFRLAGFSPLAEYHSALNPSLQAGTHRSASIPAPETLGLSMRCLLPERFEEDLRRVHALSLVCFQNNFLYTPIDEDTFLAQYSAIRPYVRPELVLLAEREDQLIGFIFAIPDLLQAQAGKPVDTVVIKTMAAHPEHAGKGLGSLLMASCETAARQAGFRRAIHALFHASNRSGKISRHTAEVIRTYTLFGRPLDIPT